jgi:homocysteine S-methyltransferase
MSAFLDALAQRVLVCDGAMGTMLYARGAFLNRAFDELNLTDPDVVSAIHRDYVDAGADVIETNTFGANRFKLVQFGLADELVRINQEGARIARQAAAGRAWVAGAMGPLGVRIAPWGRTSAAAAEAAFREQASALAAGRVDLFILETFRDLDELTLAVRAVRAVSPLPIVAQLTTGDDGHTFDGTPPTRFMAALADAGADVIGVNCSVGPAAMLETVEEMARVSDVPLAAQPNAGQPREIDGRNLYLSSPEYMASYARRFVAAGVRLVGGCCGTSPEHTRQIAAAVRATAPGTKASRVGARDEPSAERAHLIPRDAKSTLARALVEGRQVTLAEVASPRGFDTFAAVSSAQRLRTLGATAVCVPDYPRSGARASALMVALVVEQGQVETVLHYACRDRTLLEMQADLIGAHAMGVRNVLATTGLPARIGDHQARPSTFEVDSIGLITLLARLNHGLDVAGLPIGTPAGFHIGAAVNPFAPDLDREWRRLDLKIAAGAEFLITPPIFDIEAFEATLPRLAATGVPVIATLAALDGARHAEFLASEVAGVRIPDGLLSRLDRARDQADEALKITIALAARLRQNVQGLQVMAVHASPASVERLLEGLGGMPHA